VLPIYIFFIVDKEKI